MGAELANRTMSVNSDAVIEISNAIIVRTERQLRSRHDTSVQQGFSRLGTGLYSDPTTLQSTSHHVNVGKR
jgi:hypothetical protein